jgi:hypothetical protein
MNTIDNGDDSKTYFPLSDIHYNSSWEWLMPVKAKIETLTFGDSYYDVNIMGGNCTLIREQNAQDGADTEFYVDNKETPIECAYANTMHYSL